MRVLELLKGQPSWPPLSSSKLLETRRQGDDENFKTRDARLQLENVEILDEHYVYKKYFGSPEGDQVGVFPTVGIISILMSYNINLK